MKSLKSETWPKWFRVPFSDCFGILIVGLVDTSSAVVDFVAALGGVQRLNFVCASVVSRVA